MLTDVALTIAGAVLVGIFGIIVAFFLLSSLLYSCNITTQISRTNSGAKNWATLDKYSGKENHFTAFSVSGIQSIALTQSFSATGLEPIEMAMVE